MIKRLEAIRTKDGWLVKVIDMQHLYSESDVLRLIKQLGLDFQKQFSSDERIIAE